jgi:predicted lipoprotein
MIGPAIDSMGPRDGYPDLKYELFNDQTKFGAFGREINRLLSGYIREKIALFEEGSAVDSVGVLSTWDAPYDTPEIVPIIFK